MVLDLPTEVVEAIAVIAVIEFTAAFTTDLDSSDSASHAIGAGLGQATEFAVEAVCTAVNIVATAFGVDVPDSSQVAEIAGEWAREEATTFFETIGPEEAVQEVQNVVAMFAESVPGPNQSPGDPGLGGYNVW